MKDTIMQKQLVHSYFDLLSQDELKEYGDKIYQLLYQYDTEEGEAIYLCEISGEPEEY